jgi:hypothetical protein
MEAWPGASPDAESRASEAAGLEAEGSREAEYPTEAADSTEAGAAGSTEAEAEEAMAAAAEVTGNEVHGDNANNS